MAVRDSHFPLRGPAKRAMEAFDAEEMETEKGTVVKYLHTAILQQFFCLGEQTEPVPGCMPDLADWQGEHTGKSAPEGRTDFKAEMREGRGSGA